MCKRPLQAIKKNILLLFERGALHVILGSYLTKFVSLFGSVFLVRLLSKNEYGILSYYENFFGYFAIAMGLGSASGILRFLVLPDSLEEKKGIFRYAFIFGNIGNLVVGLLSLVFLLNYPHPLAFAGYSSVIFLLVFSLPFLFNMHFGLSSFRALFDNKRYAVLSFIFSFMIIAFRVLGALLGGITGTVALRLIAEIICSFICIVALHKIHFRNVLWQPVGSKMERNFRSYSLQMMLTDGLWTIFMLNDVFILGQLTGSESIVADYKVAYVIPGNLSILVAAIGVYVAPYFTKYESEGNYKWVHEKTLFVLKRTSFVLASVVVICAVFAKPLISLIFGEIYCSAVPVMRLLLLASFFNNGVRASLANIFSAIGKQNINLIIAVGGIILQIVLNVILIPRYGAKGVASASTIVYAAMSLSLGIAFQRIVKNKNS